MNEFFLLKKIDSELHRILKPVSFFEVNPDNIPEELEKVMADPYYNPVFTYSDMASDLDKVQDDLHSVDEHDSPLGRILNQKRLLYIDKSEMLKTRGTKRFSLWARKVYGLPSKPVLEKAAEFITIPSETEEKGMDARVAVNMLQAELNHYGFDYTVHPREMSASAFVNISRQKVFIKSSQLFSENYIKRLTVHEIGTHVLRAENGRRQPFMIFSHGFPDYLATEEGLAVLNEERFGLLSDHALKTYAARAIAVKMSQTKSFSDIYNYMLEFFSPAIAFKLALRTKRGLSYTSEPGGCPKDYVYIKGYLALKDLLGKAEDKDELINLLYSGKVSMESLGLLKGMQGISKPKYLPKNQTFKSLLSF